MRKYEENQEAKKDSPHPDSQDNQEFLERMLKEIYWLSNDVSFEYQDSTNDLIYDPIEQKRTNLKRISEYKCFVFLWEEKGKRYSWNWSVHQPNAEFRRGLAKALNACGSRGLLCHRKKDDRGFRRDAQLPDQSWTGNAWEDRPGTGLAINKHQESWSSLFGSSSPR